jgi:creatinine amidohydrolase
VNKEKDIARSHMLADLNWKDLAALIQHETFFVLLPVGSTESHGPHAPLATDALISTAVCQRAAERLQERSCEAYVLPPLCYTVTETAREFPGSISISPETDSTIISEICTSLIKQGMHRICIFNSHFEPSHIKAIYDAIERVQASMGGRVLFVDVTRKRYSSRLPDAYQRAETHADLYETSLIMAVDPSLVNEERRKSLPCLPMNLADKLFKEGLNSFIAFGMTEAYCGDPASASAQEGERLLETLSNFVVEDIKEYLAGRAHAAGRGLYGRES